MTINNNSFYFYKRHILNIQSILYERSSLINEPYYLNRTVVAHSHLEKHIAYYKAALEKLNKLGILL